MNLTQCQAALREWFDKTAWLRASLSTFPPSELGKHHADVMRNEIMRLRALVASHEALMLRITGAAASFANEARAATENGKRSPARSGFLDLALSCGADITGTPDGWQTVTVVFTPDAWQKFDAAVLVQSLPTAPTDVGPT